MVVGELLSETTIRIDLDNVDKWSAIDRLTDLLVKAGRVTNPDVVRLAVLEREEQGSTGLGNGIALPHARTTGVADVAVALGISQKGIDFQAPDGIPCRLIFLILTHPRRSERYLDALAVVASLGQQTEVVSRICSARSVGEVMGLLNEIAD